MNKTQIEWTDYTWNPLTGCSRNCFYCYAARMAKRQAGRNGYPKENPFAVTFHPDKLDEPAKVKKPSKIFTCSMGELFDSKSYDVWIQWILGAMKKSPQHTFQILTKRPWVLPMWKFPDNAWVGTSIDGATTSLSWIWELEKCSAKTKFVSFEPLLIELGPCLDGVDWVIIGGCTGPKPFIPPKEWVDKIIKEARRVGAAIFLKDNLGYPEKIQEFPQSDSCTKGDGEK